MKDVDIKLFDQLRQEHAHQKQLIHRLETENAQLRARVEDVGEVRRTRDSFRRELGEAVKTIAELQGELNEIRTERDDLRRENRALEIREGKEKQVDVIELGGEGEACVAIQSNRENANEREVPLPDETPQPTKRPRGRPRKTKIPIDLEQVNKSRSSRSQTRRQSTIKEDESGGTNGRFSSKKPRISYDWPCG